MELKRIDFETGKFEANGTQYTVESHLGIERYCEYQVFEKELAYGVTFKEMFKKLVKLNGLLNNTRFTDSAVLVNDLMRGIAKVEEREPVVLKICALFINTADEDRAIINNDMIVKKIADWKAEGLDMRDFFTVALNSVTGFLDVYAKITRSITGPISVLTDEGQATD